MKLRFYLDIYSGSHQQQWGYSAMTNPCQKIDGAKRYAFDVVIPDTQLHDVDAFAPEVGRPEFVPDHSGDEA